MGNTELIAKARALAWISILLVPLLGSEAAFGRIVRIRNARQGVLDAEIVVIVSQPYGGDYRIDEIFLGDARVGDRLRLPDLRLFTPQQYGPDLIDPLSSSTRILLFLQRKEGYPNSWEPTDSGYCFFWVQDPGKVYELRNTAQNAVSLRKQWEDAASISNPAKRVERLWPFLRLREYGSSFLEHTKREMRKVGPLAGDYFADHFDSISRMERSALYYDFASFGSEKLHQTMIRHLRNQQQLYEGFLAAHGIEGKEALENWDTVPQEVQDAYGEVTSLLYGLRGFGDRADLPLFRDGALWALRYGVEQAGEMALGALREMPDKDNLPTIAAIWKAAEGRPSENKEIIRHGVVGALCTHVFPETVPLLAAFVVHPYAGPEVHAALVRIVGRDLGAHPKAWLEWSQRNDAPE